MLGLGLLVTSPSVTAAAGPVPQVERSFRIALDPGHGGSNSGCTAFDGAIHEKDLTLVMAQELQVALARRLPHAQVVLTRSSDETVTLAERVQRANASGADLFISLHANASGTTPQTGFETYILDVELAEREAVRTARAPHEPADAARAQAGAMMRQLASMAHRVRSAGFAHRVQQQQAQRFPTRPDRGVKQGAFDVLLGVEMPAVLFEAGFLDHPREGARLLDSAQRGLVVEGLTEAIVDYYREHARQH